MLRKAILRLVLASIGVFASLPLAWGQAYTCTVLYQQTQPSGPSPEPATGLPGQTAGSANGHAVVWTNSGVAVDLNPTNLGGFIYSYAFGNGGAQQVGFGYGPATGAAQYGGYHGHALLWTGTAISAVDLNPTNLSGFTDSQALATNGAQQVGVGSGAAAGFDNNGGEILNALLWNGTAASAVDLNPTSLGLSNSDAEGTDGTHQVGVALDANAHQHALLWSGTAASAVDLSPTDLSGFTDSEAKAVSGNQEVGSGTEMENLHALLWTGTANSAVDLHPTNLGRTYLSSGAINTNTTEQIGWAEVSVVDQFHAMIWNGTAASAVDLSTYLPLAGGWTGSEADTFDSDGNIYGLADNSSGQFVVEWTPVPEPPAAALLLIFGTATLLRRPHKHLV